MVAALLAASSAPSPLYVVYQQRFGFSAATLTAVFGVYALALLVALLTVGGISDVVGRRPVLVVSLLVQAVAMLVFLRAGGVGGLLVARAVQGVATGAATGVLSALLVDLQPRDDQRLGALVVSVGSSVGLALGALGSGLLVRFAPHPTSWVFAGLAVLFPLLALAALLLPEPVVRRPGALASLRPRVAIPRPARSAFVSAAPVLVATWAMGGLYLSLGPSLSAGVLHQSSRLVGALVVVVFTAAGAAATLPAAALPPRTSMVGGALGLAAGTLLLVAGLQAGSVGLFFAGTAVAGAGFGPAFSGALRSVVLLVEATQRAGLLASVYVASYLAFSLPAISAGELVSRTGLLPVATAYGLLVTALALLSVGLALRGNRRTTAPGLLSAQPRAGD